MPEACACGCWWCRLSGDGSTGRGGAASPAGRVRHRTCLREVLPHQGQQVGSKGARQPHHALPQQALALVHAHAQGLNAGCVGGWGEVGVRVGLGGLGSGGMGRDGHNRAVQHCRLSSNPTALTPGQAV